ncbi:MAG: phosphopentomutase [Firmicutes bacterium]|jgi:phosphopentomutase|nr:phosphopentomutase [Bacillota bacterium]
MSKVVLIVTDSMGVGALPDAADYGDIGADTFGHILEKNRDLKIPNLKKLGIGNIDDVAWSDLACAEPMGAFGKMAEISRGKDTITGHWEIAGIYTDTPFKTYPDGFPQSFISEFEKNIGVGVLGNYPTSGTEVIEKLGPEHEATGKPIVYTSADSVFQIAANIDVIPLQRLYEICEEARRLLVGDVACGRVIARPYVIKDGKRIRTSDRKDYAVSPPEDTVLDKIKQAGKTVYAVGKISDIFNGKGMTKAVHTDNNMDGVDKTIEALKMDFDGFVFTNLVDFDSQYGHRRDPVGYGKCIEEFDARIPEIIKTLCDDDILMICADHGNDPVHSGFDHTREYVPLLVYGKKVKAGVNLGIRNSFADIGATAADILGAEQTNIGESFKEVIL